MKLKLTLLITVALFSYQKIISQCFEIESILVDACDNGREEAYNEMVKFKVGNTPLNTSNLIVKWPVPVGNIWLGLTKNEISASKVADLNTKINLLGGCGKFIEPIDGILPKNSKVILVDSYNFDISMISFGAIIEDIYIIFQDKNSLPNTGNFGNAGSVGSRTLLMSFGSCSDSVTYDSSLLVNINGGLGIGTAALTAGASVNFTPSGTASYVNYGCQALFNLSTITVPVVTLNSNVLYSNVDSGNQWYNQDGKILGATNSEFTPTTSGNYYVIVTVSGCSSSPSNIISYNSLGVKENDLKKFKLFPIPVKDILNISSPKSSSLLVNIYDSLGRLVKTNITHDNKVELSSLLSGLYFVQIHDNENTVYKDKFIKE
jgi:hypothetical protein